jgi:hypothetical protein
MTGIAEARTGLGYVAPASRERNRLLELLSQSSCAIQLQVCMRPLQPSSRLREAPARNPGAFRSSALIV